MVREACRSASAWPLADQIDQLPLVCVNVSPRLLSSRELVDEIERAVQTSRIPARRLVLELTERATVEDAATAFAGMRRLRASGVRIAIDDFGAGYASLSHLRELPVDILKLDKVFVKGIATDPGLSQLTRGILELARTLGKLVIAEGIEHPDQAERLREYGCVLGQGYLFSPPLEAGELHTRLTADVSTPV